MPKGSLEALYALSKADWQGVDNSSNKEAAISAAMASQLDVVLVKDPRKDGAFFSIPDAALQKNWTMDALSSMHGFLRITRPSVVMEEKTGLVMGVFLNKTVMPDLANLAAKLPALHTLLRKRMAPCRRRGLYMFGFRYNQQRDCHKKEKRNLRTGYYTCKTASHAAHLFRDKAAKALIVEVASAICGLEKVISPAMAKHRLHHATKTGHPGIWPRVSIKRCVTPCIGASQGYCSKVHRDQGSNDMSETIAFNSKGLPKSAEYCFAVADAGVVFDLSAGGDASMVMVPGSIRHGTPGLNPKFKGEHLAVGVVVIGKENMTRKKALRDTKWTCDRLEDGNVCNPFIAKFAIYKELECECCEGLSSTSKNRMFACDECNDGYHVNCLGAHPIPTENKVWYCPKCLPIVKQAVRSFLSG